MYSTISWNASDSVVVRVDVDDQEILVFALDRLFGGMGERLRGVVVLEREVALLDRTCFFGFCIHERVLLFVLFLNRDVNAAVALDHFEFLQA